MSRRSFAAATIALALLPLAAAAATVEVSYLANEGIALATGGEIQVVADALFGDGLDGYPTVPVPVRGRLERAEREFAGVRLVLATHHHADHFDAAAVARHLAANPRAHFVSTPQAVERLQLARGPQPDSGRIHSVLPAEGGRDSLQLDGDLRLTAFNLHHGRQRTPAVENLGFRIELGGITVLLVGDTEATFDELAALGLAREGVDLAVLPYWHLLRDDAAAGIRRAFAPRRLALFHLPAAGAPAAWWGELGSLDATIGFLRTAWPGAEPLYRHGQRIEATPSGLP